MKKKIVTKRNVIIAGAAVVVLAALGSTGNDSSETSEVATVAEASSIFDTEIESTVSESSLGTQVETEIQTELVIETVENPTSEIEIESETVQPQENEQTEILTVTESKHETTSTKTADQDTSISVIEQTPAPEQTPVTELAPDANNGNADNFNTYDNPEQQNTTAQYVLNTSTMKIHIPTCSAVKKIKLENYAESDLSIAELEAQKYERCGICLK